MPGNFITLDGIDGTGKSTQCRLLADWLRGRGLSVLLCSDPGGTPLGDELRKILLGHRGEMTLACEAFLFMASRAELTDKIIRPARANDQWVISDRFLLANVVYQGHGGGLDVDELWRVGRLSTGNLEPDMTIVLDLPVEVAQLRRGRDPDRMENRDRQYRERVRQGFLAEASRKPEKIIVVDAGGPVDAVQSVIRGCVGMRFFPNG